MLVSVWTIILLSQHAIVQKQHLDPIWTRNHSDSKRLKGDLLETAKTTSEISQPRERPANKTVETAPVVRTFNNIPVVYHRELLSSHVDCVGDAWKQRSCRFQNLCFDLQQNDFVVVQGVNDSSHHLNRNISSVALGGINPRWDQGDPGPSKGSWKMEWFPRVMPADSLQSGYYKLPKDLVWVPFHSMAGHNVGHLLWDDFYPIFRLLRLWNLLPSRADGGNNDRGHQLLLFRQKLPPDQTLYATCDIRRNKRMQCKHNFLQFVSIMGMDPSTFSSSRDFQWNSSSGPSFVCSETAVAGIGLLTDHGLADHGWDTTTTTTEYLQVPHNLGHGRDLFAFREYILDNTLGSEQVVALQRQRGEKRRIVFSVESSKDWDRRLNFTQHQKALHAHLDLNRVTVEAHRLWQLSLEDQLRLAVQTDVFVTVCGGGSMTATFLPRGATLIVFYNPTGGYDYAHGIRNHQPARLDWDLLNHAASHLRVHWMPITETTRDETARDNDRDLDIFVELIRHELQVMESL